jgi:hypothetical protein
VKRPSDWVPEKEAILLAATADLHLNECVLYHGDKAAGIEK